MPELENAEGTTENPALPFARLEARQTAAGDDTTDSGGASDASVAALNEGLEYAITVGQALERFLIAGRKPPSERTIQRYCIEGRLAAQKIRTTYGSEWLINQASLTRLIEDEPVVISAASVVGDAKAPTQTTDIADSANNRRFDATDSDDASVATIARPEETVPQTETRSLGEVLIANARLLAEVEGRDAIIEELREDKAFLREEVREARKTRDDVKNIAAQMLDTLKTIAVGRVGLNSGQPEMVRPPIIVTDERPADQSSG